MAGPRHLQDKDAHKSLFETLRGEMGSAFASLSESVNGLLEPIRTATHFPDPNTIMKRDAAGRVRVADPVDKQDVVTKGYFEDNSDGDTQIAVFTETGVFEATKTGVVTALLVGGGSGGKNKGASADGDKNNGGAFVVFVPVEKGIAYDVVIGAAGVPSLGLGGITSFGGYTSQRQETTPYGWGGVDGASKSGPITSGGVNTEPWGISTPTAAAAFNGSGGFGWGACGADGASSSDSRRFGTAGIQGCAILFLP